MGARYCKMPSVAIVTRRAEAAKKRDANRRALNDDRGSASGYSGRPNNSYQSTVANYYSYSSITNVGATKSRYLLSAAKSDVAQKTTFDKLERKIQECRY